MRAMHTIAAWAVLALAGGGLVLAGPGSASAQDASKEVSTAAQHAGFAAQAKDMKGAQMHLHHVINCLVGPKGKSFDAKEANPCKDQGNGALADTTDAGKKKSLRGALAKAHAGIKAKNLATAQKDATAAQDLLNKAM